MFDIDNFLEKLLLLPEKIKSGKHSDLLFYISFNLLFILFQLIYLGLRYQYINTEVPFYYTKEWGESQLATKNHLFEIPMLSTFLFPVGIIFYFKIRKFFMPYAQKMLIAAITATNLLLSYALYRIINIASLPFEPLIPTKYQQLVIPFFVGFGLTYLIAPKLIQTFRKNGLETNPELHQHPGMVLQKASARGGGLIFILGVVLVSLIFVELNKMLMGIFIAAGIIALLGILDDYQNTRFKTRLRFFENPFIRMGLLSLIVLIPVLLGIKISYISNPFDGIFMFSDYVVSLGGQPIQWLVFLFTALWFVWVLNLLSWSNGVDGQYGGIVGIAFIVIAILAVRFNQPTNLDMQVAKLAIIASGAAWAVTRYNWYPSKVMWGFGAMSAGLIIATTSVLIGSKIAVSIIILLIPFLDATVTILRRLLQRKNPMKGDKGHLHHLLYQRGWGVRRISVFYWFTTALTGVVGIISANRDLPLVILTLAGIVAFFIAFLNVQSILTLKKSKS